MTKIDHGPMKIADFETLLMNKYGTKLRKFRPWNTKTWVFARTDGLQSHVGTWQRSHCIEFDDRQTD